MRLARLAWILLLFAMAARADVVTPDSERRMRAPRDCPPGAIGVAGSHGSMGRSPYCAPTTCTDDASCERTARPCRVQPLCIDERPTYQPTPSGEEGTYPIARSVCAADGTCSLGTCVTARRCVGRARSEPEPEPQMPPASVTPPSTMSCAAARGATSNVAVWMSLLALWCLRRRRHSGLWQTASTLLPSGSSTKLP